MMRPRRKPPPDPLNNLPKEAYSDDGEDSGERRVDSKWLMREYVNLATKHYEIEKEMAKHRLAARLLLVGFIVLLLLYVPASRDVLFPILGRLTF